jgi:hypothetical protein
VRTGLMQRQRQMLSRLRRGLPLAAAVALLLAANVAVEAQRPQLLRLTDYREQGGAAQLAVYYDSPRSNVLLMGSSRARCGLDAGVMHDRLSKIAGREVSVLQLSTAGGPVPLYYLFFKNIVSDQKKPDVIVYGLAEAELNSSNYQTSVYARNAGFLMHFDDVSKFSSGSPNNRALFLFRQVFPLYRDRDLVRGALSTRFNPYDPSHRRYLQGKPPRDPCFSGGIAPDESRSTYPLMDKFQLQGPSLDRLRDFLALAAARDVKVVLVNMPVMPSHLKFWASDMQRKRYRDTVRAVAEEYGVSLLDVYENEEGEIPRNGFFDSDHLNPKGAAVLSRLIANRYLAPLYARTTPTAADVPIEGVGQ